MKLSTIPMAVFVFAIVVVGGVSIFNASDPTKHGISSNETTIFSKYDRLEELYDNSSKIYDGVKGSSSGEADSNFLVSLSSMWSSIQLFFDTFSFGIDSSTDIQEDLGVPPTVRYALLGIVFTALIVLVISAAIRWKVD